ncbi:MAG: ornithine cyclodeaminase family protein [Desulfobulbaceae bacterium]|nr:ornithine cyclodeaminase family protein [Desulfobulbaceae bacterium]
MTSIFHAEQIKEIVHKLDISEQLEQGFVAYSQNNVVVPPVGELVFENPPGDAHIKYGYIKEDDYFVIKIASGFYENHKLDLPSSSGLMLLFSQKTGMLVSVLIDEGYLTNVRTAIAGQIVAKYMAPKEVNGIGVFGTGIQGRLQVEYLKPVTDCRKVVVWGQENDDFASYISEMETKGYTVETTTDVETLTRQCNLIITATPSRTPLIQAEQLLAGTHITAMGSDTPEKQELDSEILKKADIIVADSIEQCLTRGEIHKALEAGMIKEESVFELGNVILQPNLGRTSENQLTVADLTGVAVQDIQITKAVYQAIREASGKQ